MRLIDDQERDVGDRYYKTGSTIDLQCQVSRSFLYKEKQNILKSLKPLNGHRSSYGPSSTATSNTGPSVSEKNTSSNSNQTRLAANSNGGGVGVSPGGSGAVNGFASAVNGQFPSTNYSVTVNKNNNNNRQTGPDHDQGSMLENEFSNLVFWSKDDEELPPSALKRLR